MHLSDAPQRLQMLLLKIQPYDFVIKYVPGIMILMVDPLADSVHKRRVTSKVNKLPSMNSPKPDQTACRAIPEGNPRR